MFLPVNILWSFWKMEMNLIDCKEKNPIPSQDLEEKTWFAFPNVSLMGMVLSHHRVFSTLIPLPRVFPRSLMQEWARRGNYSPPSSLISGNGEIPLNVEETFVLGNLEKGIFIWGTIFVVAFWFLIGKEASKYFCYMSTVLKEKIQSNSIITNSNFCSL